MADYESVPSGCFALELGEGPVWNPVTQTLSIVDIFERQVHLLDLDNSQVRHRGEFSTEGDIGAALPLADGSYVLCESGGVFLRAPDGTRSLVCDLPSSGSDLRFNDGKLGPDGKLWVGVMDYAATEGRGSLWRIGRDGESQCLLDGLTIPNGLDWWGDEFWFVDGPEEVVSCYPWDESGLSAVNRRFVTDGTPDGLSIDSQGDLWLALWGEGRVDHFNREGHVVDSVSVASPHSTSLCFAGRGLDTLVMTSAQFNMSPEDLAQLERAGDLFVLPVPRRGRIPHLEFH